MLGILPNCSFLLIVGLVITFLTSSLAATKPTVAKPNGTPLMRLGSDALTRSSFEHFYNMEYDKAIRGFEQVVQAHPEDPAAVNHLTSAVLFKELYRIGAMDTELFANDDFLESRHFSVDPKVRARIRELTERSLDLCEKRLKADPNDVEALYARGVARATRCMTQGMLDKSWFGALRSAIGARRDHERVLELNPKYEDAKMVVGVHNYILGSVTWAVKVAASVIGLSGNKQKGIQYLYEAAAANGETSVDAKISLSLFLRREQRYAEAINLVNGLVQAYPRNFLVALEHANLLNAAGRGPEAIAAYRKLLSSGKDGLYLDPRLEQAAYGLGEALRGQNNFQGAAEAYEMVKTFPTVDPELQVRAELGAGQMFDMMQQRDLAIKKYQTVIAKYGDTPHAGSARKYLKKPYSGQKRG